MRAACLRFLCGAGAVGLGHGFQNFQPELIKPSGAVEIPGTWRERERESPGDVSTSDLMSEI